MIEPLRFTAPFTAAVLTGGQSRRMGRDKALVAIDGTPMALRVMAAMQAAGAAEVLAIGGDRDRLMALGIPVLEDQVLPNHVAGDQVLDHQAANAGPLAGIITALGAATHEVVVVTACDMPWIEADHVRSLVDALVTSPIGVSAAVSASAGQLQPLHAAWHRRALPVLRDAFAAGERSPARLIPTLGAVIVELGLGRWATDVDTPGDLPGPN